MKLQSLPTFLVRRKNWLLMAALALCWAYALCALRDRGLGRGAVLGIALFVALYPVLALYAFNMCKDISAEPFVLLYLTMMLKLHWTDGRAAESVRFCVGLFVCSLLMMMTRKPAMYALCFASAPSAITRAAPIRR